MLFVDEQVCSKVVGIFTKAVLHDRLNNYSQHQCHINGCNFLCSQNYMVIMANKNRLVCMEIGLVLA